jgi:hypothetical protein
VTVAGRRAEIPRTSIGGFDREKAPLSSPQSPDNRMIRPKYAANTDAAWLSTFCVQDQQSIIFGFCQTPATNHD